MGRSLGISRVIFQSHHSILSRFSSTHNLRHLCGKKKKFPTSLIKSTLIVWLSHFCRSQKCVA